MESEILENDPLLREIVRRLVTAYAPERIYLFGSRARGDADSDSDYDLMLIVPDDASPDRRRSRMAYEVLRGTGRAADVLVWTRTRFDSRRRVRASLPATVASEGRLISLEEIGEQCLDVDRTLRSLVDRAVPLTEYAWRFRYPGEPEEPSLEEADQALAIAREVYASVLARLPPEARP
jgi:predicted nucleotidyltransferase